MGTIYLIRNTLNGKCYVGQTTHNVVYRINQHLKSGIRGSKLVKQAVAKYGHDAFEVEILHDGILDFMLDDLERGEIRNHNALTPNGYNIDTGGNSNKTLTAETKLKISETKKGQSPPNKGKPMSDKQRRKLSEAHKGKKHSAEHRQKVSEGLKRYYASDESKETRKKLSKASQNRIKSEETRRKISESQRGKKLSVGHRKKLSEAKIGKKRKPFTNETRQKMSEARFRPEFNEAKSIFFSLPADMLIGEKRKQLYNTYPHIHYSIIWRWIRKWQSELT